MRLQQAVSYRSREALDLPGAVCELKAHLRIYPSPTDVKRPVSFWLISEIRL